MLIVMVIITVLILLIVPGITKQSENVHAKGCDALVKAVQTQVVAYHLNNDSYPPTLEALVGDYIEEDQLACSNGVSLNYNVTTGLVTADEQTP